MKRQLCCAFLLAVSVSNTASAAVTALTFDSASPGTINDSTGQGTGFTHRLPGSGSAIAANDPNLTLDTVNGRLVVGSTRSDFNLTGFGRNLSGMEAPALLLSGIGGADFLVQARFSDLHVDQLSDQIGIFAGTSVDGLIRGGVHEGATGYQSFVTNSQNGTDIVPGGGELNQFTAGQDALIEIGRIAGVWHFRWQNLSDPSFAGSVENLLIPDLNLANDLYVGIFNNDARNTTPQNAYLDYFVVRTGVDVPEPSSIVLLCMGLAAIGFYRRSARFAQ